MRLISKYVDEHKSEKFFNQRPSNAFRFQCRHKLKQSLHMLSIMLICISIPIMFFSIILGSSLLVLSALLFNKTTISFEEFLRFSSIDTQAMTGFILAKSAYLRKKDKTTTKLTLS